jgi:putative isomerase
LVPGATYENLWDWDSFFVACAMPEEALNYAKGSILNLLEGTRPDGRPPKMAAPDGTYIHTSHPYPLQAQFCFLIGERMRDFGWIEPYWETLCRIDLWYQKETFVRGNYPVWLGFQGNGLDNNPAVYGRPPKSSSGIDLACWHYRDLRAMEKLARDLNKPGAEEFGARAGELAAHITARYWDQMDEFFYNIDCLADTRETSLQGITWETFLRFRSWTAFFPMWAGIATPAQAEALLKKIMDPAEFLSPAGIRSLSGREPLYNNMASGNPSNWQGPVWGLSTFVTTFALNRYGHEKEAASIASRMVCLFAADIRTNKCLHEYYHGDTGQPVIKPGFLSWNLLALGVLSKLRNRNDPTSGSLLAEASTPADGMPVTDFPESSDGDLHRP